MTGNVITATVSGVFLLLAGLLNLAPWASDRRNRRYLEAQRRIDLARDTLSKQEVAPVIDPAQKSPQRDAPSRCATRSREGGRPQGDRGSERV
jgi:hypothetical protein